MLAQGARVGVGLIAHLAEIRLIGGVDVHVLLPVAAVGETPVAALELTLERLLPCVRQTLAPEPLITRAAQGQAAVGPRKGCCRNRVPSPLNRLHPHGGRSKAKLPPAHLTALIIYCIFYLLPE